MPGLSCGTWVLWCSMWVLAPWPGLEPRPPALRAQGLSRWATREVPNEPFLDGTVMCNKRWILHYSWWWPAQWLDREEAPKHFPKPNLDQKKVMVSDGLIHYSFLNPSTTIISGKCAQQIKQIHPKLQCLQPVLVNRMNGPTSPRQCSTTCRTTNASKVEWIGLWSFASSIWPLANWLPLVQHLNFLQGRCFHKQQEAENAFQEFAESQSMDFSTRGVNEFISHWQKMCWL